MTSRRQVQVADAIQRHMSDLIQRELKDPRIGFATVTRAEVSQDLKYARIYISVLGSPEEQKGTMEALERGKGFIRREIGQRLNLRAVPEIQFRLDTSAEYADNINRLLNELNTGESPQPTPDGSGTDGAQPSQEGTA